MLSSKNSYYLVIFSWLILLYSCTKTEPSAIQKDTFIKSFGGAYGNNAIDFIYENGNYYILGNTTDKNDSTHIFLAKTDEYGNRVLPNDLIYSPAGKQTLAGQIIKLEHQAGFAIIGAIQVDDTLSFFDTYLIIIDENGKVTSESIYPNTFNNDYGKCIGELQDGSFTISTLSVSVSGGNDSIKFITTSLNGAAVENISSIIGSELFQICKRKNNEGFYVTAYATIPSKLPIIALIDSEGKLEATQKFGSIEGQIRGIIQDDSGNTFVCGKLDAGFDASNQGFIAKLTHIEESIGYDWLKEFGDLGTDYLEQIILTKNNELFITGSYEDTRIGAYDIWIMKTDLAGNLISQIFIGGDKNEYGIRILESDENKYVVEGTTFYENNSLISIFKSEFK